MAAGLLLAGCGAHGNSASDTVSGLPTVTAPRIGTETQQQKGSGKAPAQRTQTAAAAPSGSSPSSGSSNDPSRGGGTKPARQTKPQRQKQTSCEKQVAHLPEDQQRQALAQCLNPTSPAPEAPETTQQR